MNVMDPGHEYLLDAIDGDLRQRLVFVKRQGEKYPGNVGHHPGTTMQEVLRALIDRATYVNRQIPCPETELAIAQLQTAVYLFESRAARRHGRPFEVTLEEVVSGVGKCAGCGHVGCPGCRAHHQVEPVTEYVVGFLFAEQHVALIRKARPSWQRGRINGIGGKVESGEDPQRAMSREFEEETGVATGQSEWSHRVTLEGRGWRIYFFAAFLEHRVKLKEDGDEPCYWYPISFLPGVVLPNLYWLLPLCLDEDLRHPVLIFDDSDPAVDGATVRSTAHPPEIEKQNHD